MEAGHRFSGLDWFKSEFEPVRIVVGGQGGIGSWLTLLLSRVSNNASIYCYDHDTIEQHNIGGQLFSHKDLGKRKAIAMHQMVKDYGIKNINPLTQKFEEGSYFAPVMFSCFDNMKARKDMFETWLSTVTNDNEKLFVDGRLLAENYEIYFVTPDKADRYRETLFDDNEIEDVPCSEKQTSHFAASIAADMIKGYTNWLSNRKYDTREVPFKVEEMGAFFHKTVEM